MELIPTYDELLDAIEVQMHKSGLVDVPIVHQFTPGLYTRSMKDVPPNTYLLSHIHKTDHQYILSKGEIVIYTPEEGMIVSVAPVIGITKSGTRRFAKTLTEVTWTSIHATSIYPMDNSQEAFDRAVELVEMELYSKHENIYLIKEERCQH